MSLSLEKLRRAAKSLRVEYNSHDMGAHTRVAQVIDPLPSRPIKHAQALHVIARETGFVSWPHLKEMSELQGLDRAARLQHLKIALAHGQTSRVLRLLEDDPGLPEGQFALQVALLNKPEVFRLLAEDPKQATQLFGPRRPIVHLAFSRMIHAWPDKADDMLQIASMLVAHGADVNDSCPVGPGNDHQLSALYGAIGHSDNMILGRWLLEQGANPNDDESLYHATELGHHEGLQMLLAHGADPKGTNALLRAMDFHDHDAVRLLLNHGAQADEFDGTHVGGEAPWVVPALHQAARRMSDRRMIDLLLEAGADPARVFEGASAYGYACVFGNKALMQAIERRGAEVPLTPVETLLAAVADGQDPQTRLDPRDLPVAYRNIIRTILHLPGKLGHVRRLVALGVEHDRPDSEGLTPVQVAGWEGLPDVMQYLLSLGPDLAHVNGFGGTLLSTIIHGSENCPQRAERDYPACLELALKAGVPLPRSAIDFAGDEEVRAFLTEWAETGPGPADAPKGHV